MGSQSWTRLGNGTTILTESCLETTVKKRVTSLLTTLDTRCQYFFLPTPTTLPTTGCPVIYSIQTLIPWSQCQTLWL